MPSYHSIAFMCNRNYENRFTEPDLCFLWGFSHAEISTLLKIDVIDDAIDVGETKATVF